MSHDVLLKNKEKLYRFFVSKLPLEKISTVVLIGSLTHSAFLDSWSDIDIVIISKQSDHELLKNINNAHFIYVNKFGQHLAINIINEKEVFYKAPLLGKPYIFQHGIVNGTVLYGDAVITQNIYRPDFDSLIRNSLLDLYRLAAETRRIVRLASINGNLSKVSAKMLIKLSLFSIKRYCEIMTGTFWLTHRDSLRHFSELSNNDELLNWARICFDKRLNWDQEIDQYFINEFIPCISVVESLWNTLQVKYSERLRNDNWY